MVRRLLTALALTVTCIHATPMKVAALHPLLADLAREIGKDHVEVIDLMGPNNDPHSFQPNPEELNKAQGARLYLVSGMGLEDYLPKLKGIVASSQGAELIDVGSTLPPLEQAEVTDHDHDHHTIDPHWWHSIRLFQRATGVIAESFASADSEHAAEYRQNAQNYRDELGKLDRWAKREIAKIPRANRHLATAHAAFNYFCHDFGFEAFPIQGINHEQMPDPRELANLIAALKKNQVSAIFPEKESNPKILQTLTEDTGIQLAAPLIADGRGVKNYEEMVRYNVSTIVKALAP
ncbi:zinc ABC transporter substrate-binding protein [Luteolibacter pohnpeiensis]|uniref:Zinc ABC transporter substrate-binding protein n=1 Tax=Luteolibacter pohnpeiensis TaxID=454153 RepID=A0A934SAD5_9BACT|nr:metal ABC transporter substrate-binding protein [Luteolibacter pohnpeiensis]MBK1884219.1 zinc ABC transporter substrate-binding protein [Luteolibacter pohnpeiensis]